MSLKILVGKNNSGKTHYLKDIHSKNNDDFLYVPCELNILDFYSTNNLGNVKKPEYTPHTILVAYINDLIRQNFNNRYTTQIKQNDLDEYKSIKDDISKNLMSIPTRNDEFDENFLKIFNLTDISVSYEFTFPDLIELNLKDSKDIKTGSGIKIYSLLLVVLALNDCLSIKNKKLKNLLIDEPEKFLHDELINKMARLLIDLSKKVDIIISTHSRDLLSYILMFSKLQKYNDVKIVKMSLDNKSNHVSKDIEITNFILEGYSYEEMASLSKVFFSSNIIIVEGKYDQNFLYSILMKYFSEKNWTVLMVNGKENIKKFFNTINNFDIGIKCIPFYDLDCDHRNFNLNNQYTFDPDLEKTFFDIDASGNFLIKNFRTKPKNDLIWEIDWICANSMKNLQDINDELDKIKKHIKNIFVW